MRIDSWKTKFIALTALAIAAAACMPDLHARLTRMSSGPTGCSPRAIAVEDEQFDGTYPVTWTASCDGDRWYCSMNAIGPATCSRAKR